MTKAEFLKALEEKLSALSAQDRVASLAYYEEIIDDRMEEGMDEQAAVCSRWRRESRQAGIAKPSKGFRRMRNVLILSRRDRAADTSGRAE